MFIYSGYPSSRLIHGLLHAYVRKRKLQDPRLTVREYRLHAQKIQRSHKESDTSPPSRWKYNGGNQSDRGYGSDGREKLRKICDITNRGSRQVGVVVGPVGLVELVGVAGSIGLVGAAGSIGLVRVVSIGVVGPVGLVGLVGVVGLDRVAVPVGQAGLVGPDELVRLVGKAVRPVGIRPGRTVGLALVVRMLGMGLPVLRTSHREHRSCGNRCYPH